MGSQVEITPDASPVEITPDQNISLPSMANMPGGPQSQPMDSQGAVGGTLTSFATQTANTPRNMLNYLKNLPQTFREDAAQHERVMSGQESPMSEFMSALGKVNPVAMNTPGQRNSGIDYGATAANLLPLALSAAGSPKGSLSQIGRAGLEVGKTGLRVADVATFNRISQAARAIGEGGTNIRSIMGKPPVYPGAPLPEHPGVFPGAHLPADPGTFPGAPLPAQPPVELLKARALAEGGKPITSPSDALAQLKAGASTTIPGDYKVVPLPNPLKPTAAATVDPYRTQLLPKMQPGTSTTIEAHGYNPNTQEMTIHFRNGSVYKMQGVPQEIYNQFQNSESQGSFHANQIKGRYRTDKIGQVKPNRFSPTLGGQK